MKPVNQPKKNNTFLKPVIAFVIFVTITVAILKPDRKESKLTESVKVNANGIVNYDLKPKFESPIFKSLNAGDWKEFARVMKEDKLPIETKLTQIIYFIDSKGFTDDAAVAAFVPTLINSFNGFELKRARELQLMSRILGKVKLDKKGQDIVESFYKQRKLLKHKTWKEVTVAWSPLPTVIIKELHDLLKPGRDDLTADFIYFVSKITDEKAKAQLTAHARQVSAQLSESQRKLLESNLQKDSRSVASERHE